MSCFPTHTHIYIYTYIYVIHVIHSFPLSPRSPLYHNTSYIFERGHNLGLNLVASRAKLVISSPGAGRVSGRTPCVRDTPSTSTKKRKGTVTSWIWNNAF